jgi:hypothetical protein
MECTTIIIIIIITITHPVDPKKTVTLYGCGTWSFMGESNERGIYKTTDGGIT